ncbi:hypothetical protein ATDW_23060 [Asticcacaulis sp. DW145]|uniref:DUF4350 domain-containing protein n=1 Tax=Asticcacaulis currens TaxID=2984210 RepID=A0ABT5IHG4_9CAUL|nr:hypothetical protein [Asticcacaulis currens]MDC7695641.1 hypothetical protein [Asticcacaulis currens]BEV11810.1 hypothetical protein ATDW_23060 [Asticcacaulis sp. DW145]
MRRLPFLKNGLPPATQFLPIIVGVLIAGLFLMVGLVLITPHLEPPGRGQAANVTGYSAQGFKGLRDVLEASDYKTSLTRQASGPQRISDLVIVTLDGDGALFNDDPEYTEPQPVPEESASSSAQATASASMTSADMQAKAKQAQAEASASRAAQEASSTSFQAEDQAKKRDDIWPTPSAEKSDRLLYYPVGKVVLVVAPKWAAGPMPSHPRWDINPSFQSPNSVFAQLALLSPVRKKAVQEDGETRYKITYQRLNYALGRAPLGRYKSYALSPAEGQKTLTKAYTSGRIRGLQSLSGPNLTPLLLGPDGEVLLSRVNAMPGEKPFKAPVYLLSEPDLMDNQMLADAERVAGALSIIKAIAPGAKTVAFDVTYNDLAYEQDLLHHVSRVPFIGVPLCLLVLAVAMLWSAYSRFGPAHDPSTDTPHGRGVTVLADNAARLIAKAGREPKLAPAYAQLVRDQALKALGLGRHSAGPDELAERLSEKHNTPERYSALRAEADRLSNPMQLLSWARRLHAWKHQITER